MAQPTYSSRQTVSISLASTGSSSDWTAGRESNQEDNITSARYNDVILQGFITVGTSPTAGTAILIYVWGSSESAAVQNLDTLTGSNGARTLTSTAIRDGLLRIAARLEVNATTSDRRYHMGATSLAQLFGGNMPAYWGVFVTHNSGTALNSTGSNHELSWRGVTY